MTLEGAREECNYVLRTWHVSVNPVADQHTREHTMAMLAHASSSHRRPFRDRYASRKKVNICAKPWTTVAMTWKDGSSGEDLLTIRNQALTPQSPDSGHDREGKRSKQVDEETNGRGRLVLTVDSRDKVPLLRNCKWMSEVAASTP